VLFVGIGGVHPPQDTAKAFEQVVDAEQKYYGKVKNAEAEAIKLLTTTVGSVQLADQITREMDVLDRMQDRVGGQPNPAHADQRLKVAALIRQAGGEAAAMIVRASAERWERHMGEKARLSLYNGQIETYRAAPGIYRAALYLDAIREVMKDARVYVMEDAKKLHLRLNAEDKESVTDIFREPEN
jgi:regulator of protease activity HflC (stomatin/prohibitin superfamily)